MSLLRYADSKCARGVKIQPGAAASSASSKRQKLSINCNLATNSAHDDTDGFSSAELDSPQNEANVKADDRKQSEGWKCPLCQLHLEIFNHFITFRKLQHLKHWHPDSMHKFVRMSRWQPLTPDEKPTWKCKHCKAALYGQNKSDWQVRLDHWRKVHPKKPKEDFLYSRGRPSGTSMKIPSIAKRNALVARNMQLLKGNLNGHAPVEIIWPFAPKCQGVVKQFICRRCLRRAHLPKMIKKKCHGEKIKDKRRMQLLRKIRRKISVTKSETDKQNLQTIADLYASCKDTSHRSKKCEQILQKQRSRG